ncbi:MAG: hypothetical protein DI537_13870 [Stutzerimonas stutzeri]|nr:MAG: hypothetical protein DI537_13870 [Stutzerimonas stutzeri]
MTHKVDPVHFFNERGMSVLTEEHLLERVDELEEENARLKRLNTALLRRLKAGGQDKDEASSLDS